MENILVHVLIAAYATLIVACAVQLGRILLFRHSLFSFQTAFLTIGLLWTVLRVLFFIGPTDRPDVADLCLYWVPIDLQFATFSLVCMFYAFLVYERMWLHVRHFYRIMYALANGTVLALTTVYIILSWKHGVDPSSDLEKTHHLFMSLQFLILVITYAYYGVRLMLASSSPDKPANNLRKLSPRMILSITIMTWLIFVSRCVFNFLTTFDVIQVQIGSENGKRYISGLAFFLLFIWEVIPTSMVLIYFREIPATSFGWRTLFCLPNRSDALLLNCGSADLGSDTLLLSSEQSSPDVFGDQNAFMRSLSRPKGIQQQPTDIRIIPDIRTRYDTGSDNDSLSSSAGSEDMQHQ
ncbi:unnamed protein product (mitochondrion) [Plasmodiophora brassicae]|uniref:THH1/TOM1/TOM3 domain-containing protein n=1 Tax=Plasmodiophora brassicae TaxID=37360 RepID=A0A3P3YAK4_PLABS|nr:unnamed protein product [Plasmodiophora brassicae]